MWLKMTAGQLRSSSVDTCIPPRVTIADVSIALEQYFFATFSTPIAKKGKHTQK
jgi:hypothetical protein